MQIVTYCEIPLTQAKIAIVDIEDHGRLMSYKWRAIKSKNGRWYASAYDSANKCNVMMHRMILSAQKGQLVDHKDHNGLNNQKLNLRFCTNAQNNANSPVRKVNTLGLKGVVRVQRKRSQWKYRAYFKHDRRQIHLGYYYTAEAAAIAYDNAALEYFGEFACLNFPNPVKETE